MVGRTISHYKILEKLGEGGMGTAYKAIDNRLGRLVALKIMAGSASVSSDEEDLFKREAEILSSLNHPNIAQIFDVGREGDSRYIVLELLEGGTLREKLMEAGERRAPLSVHETMTYSVQIAKALAHAHRRGVIHRDIKPENILLTADNEIKITDFGLARLTEDSVQNKEGGLAGTISYMSPEQIRGDTIDFRTDLFSAGVVLYELLTNRLPFNGEHDAARMYSIVNEAPVPIESIRPDLPADLVNLIAKCLRKERSQRFQSAEALASELAASQRALAGGSSEAPAPRSLQLRQLTYADTVEEHPAWSPREDRIVFSRSIDGVKKLVVKSLTAESEEQLTSGNRDDIQPAWAPDDSSIAFVRSNQPNGRLEPRDIYSYFDGGDIWSISLENKKETKFVENGFNPSFSPDGEWLAFDSSRGGPRRIWVVDRRGRNPRQVTSDVSEAISHLYPRWSPDGKHIVFQNVERVKFDVRIVDVQTGKLDWLTDDLVQDVYPVWSPDGKGVYLSSFKSGGLNLWQVPLDERRMAGRARQLTVGGGQDIHAAVSPDGSKLVYANLRLNADIWRLPVSAGNGNPSGSVEPLIASTREESRGAWNRDGSAIAFNSDRTGNMNIWVYGLGNKQTRQITRGPGGDFQPNWSTDGSSLVFFSARRGKPELWITDLSGRDVRPLTGGHAMSINPFYSPDGKLIAYCSDEDGRFEPWIMNSDGSDQRKLAGLEVAGHFLRWSGDGTSVIFRSPNPTRPGLWRAFVGGTDPEFVCTPKGGAHISFSPDGTLLLDVVDHKRLWITPLDGRAPYPVFEFDDPSVRIDYPVWSPLGDSVIFDRVRPEGGNIWLMENL